MLFDAKVSKPTLYHARFDNDAVFEFSLLQYPLILLTPSCWTPTSLKMYMTQVNGENNITRLQKDG